MLKLKLPANMPEDFLFWLYLPYADNVCLLMGATNSDAFMGHPAGSLIVLDTSLDKDCSLVAVSRFTDKYRLNPKSFAGLFSEARVTHP